MVWGWETAPETWVLRCSTLPTGVLLDPFAQCIVGSLAGQDILLLDAGSFAIGVYSLGLR